MRLRSGGLWLWRYRALRNMRGFRPRQKAPLEALILHVIFAERQGRSRLGHFVAEVKGVRRVDAAMLQHRTEEDKRVVALEKQVAVQNMQKTAFREQAIIAIFEIRSQLAQRLIA